MSYQDALARVIEDVVVPSAGDVDRNGTFPHAGVDALGESGLLGLISGEEVGGGGQGLEAAAGVVAGLAECCGSTAMVVLMHYAATAAIEAHGPKDVRADVATGSAHCALGPLWAARLGRNRLHAYQPSPRGGEIGVVVGDDRVTLIGQAVTVFCAELGVD